MIRCYVFTSEINFLKSGLHILKIPLIDAVTQKSLSGDITSALILSSWI
jgi:hypothetical protein